MGWGRFGFGGWGWPRDLGWSWLGSWGCKSYRGCCGRRSRRRLRLTSGCRGSRSAPRPSLLPRHATANPLPSASAMSGDRERRPRPKRLRHLRLPHPPRSPARPQSRRRQNRQLLPAHHPRPRHLLHLATARRSSPRIEGEVGYPLRTACTSAAGGISDRRPAIHRSKLSEEGVSHLPPTTTREFRRYSPSPFWQPHANTSWS